MLSFCPFGPVPENSGRELLMSSFSEGKVIVNPASPSIEENPLGEEERSSAKVCLIGEGVFVVWGNCPRKLYVCPRVMSGVGLSFPVVRVALAVWRSP